MSEIFDSILISEEVKNEVDKKFEKIEAFYEFILLNNLIGKDMK
jgi:hypothetical protein